MKTCFFLTLLLLVRAASAAVIFGPVIYRQTSDSPFYAGIVSGDIQLEDFEDQRLSIPGVTVSLGRISRMQSIDGEDGILDYYGVNYAWSEGGGGASIYFSPDETRGYPKYVGMALLGFDSTGIPPAGTKHFQVFDTQGAPLTERLDITMVFGPPNASFLWAGGDQFMGVYAPEGISSIHFAAIGFDHLQVGWAIPEPGTSALSAATCLTCLLRRRRRPTHSRRGYGLPA